MLATAPTHDDVWKLTADGIASVAMAAIGMAITLASLYFTIRAAEYSRIMAAGLTAALAAAGGIQFPVQNRT